MKELNLIETQSNLIEISLKDQTKFRLNEINGIKGYCTSGIQERKVMIKN